MSNVAYTCVLDADRQTAEFVSRQLASHRRTLGTRTGTRALSPFKQAVLLIRWFRSPEVPVDGSSEPEEFPGLPENVHAVLAWT